MLQTAYLLQEIFRMFPANYSDLVATIKAGYKTQVELQHCCSESHTCCAAA
jgi:hypothetical protein